MKLYAAVVLFLAVSLNGFAKDEFDLRYESTCYFAWVDGDWVNRPSIRLYRGDKELSQSSIEGVKRLIELLDNRSCQFRPLKCSLGGGTDHDRDWMLIGESKSMKNIVLERYYEFGSKTLAENLLMDFKKYGICQ